VDGELHPGLTSRVEVSLVEDDGRPSQRVPRLVARGGAMKLIGTVSPGVWTVAMTPDTDVSEMEVTAVDVVDRPRSALPVAPLAESTLTALRRIDAAVDDETAIVRVTGPHLPPPEGLVVSVAEGRVLSVEPVDDALV